MGARDSKLVLVSPDSFLGRLPLAALPGNKPNTFLIEETPIVNIAAPALLPSIFSETPEPILATTKSLLIGDIDYGKMEQPAAGIAYPPLAATRAELNFIADRLSEKTMLSGSDANESKIKKLVSKHKLIHFATHGLFRTAEQIVGNSEMPNGQISKAKKILEQNPNMLSGLALANANSANRSGVGQPDEDGMLYAAEIAMLPMQGVELAVLSACDTGLGADAGWGEGLIGIQRAFQVAGAKSVVASYWKVDDRATQLLMNKFYENLLEYSKNVDAEQLKNNQTTIRIDALRDAQLWMLNNPILASATNRGEPVPIDPKKIKDATEQRTKFDKGQRTHPRYWAAFMLSGDWR